MIIRSADVPQDRLDEGGMKLDSLLYSDAGGLTQFGAHVGTVWPGAASSERHWHEGEDEFLLVLDGTATIHDDDGMHDLLPGDAACWQRGDPNAHHVLNRTGTPCRYLIVGSRAADGICHYPDSGSKLVNGASRWQVVTADGSVLREGDLPDQLLNLPAPWGRPFDPARPGQRVLRTGDVAPETAVSSYPAPYTLPSGRMRWWALSDAGGLSQFGAATEELSPGAQSSQRHWHAAEDEFLYVLDGEVTVAENDGEHVLAPGDAACWPAGAPNAHCLINRSDRPVTYVIVGTRARDDEGHYPDIDLHYIRRDGLRGQYHKDGTPYPGWPKETDR